LLDGFKERARKKLNEAEEYFNHLNYPESISASQECMELSAKAAFLLTAEKYPRRHEFKDEEIGSILEKIPEGAKHINFLKLFMEYDFWRTRYTLAKYGNEKLNASPKEFFDKQDAELAKQRAHEWYIALQTLDYVNREKS